mgnify:CR=1 FL=1
MCLGSNVYQGGRTLSQKEYGGYMEMEHFHGKEYHMTPFRFNTAHHALRFLLREK